MHTASHNRALSIAKGIGIILMVIGHSGCPLYLHRFIYLFHMPLFFFVSGYLFKDRYLESKTLFLKRKLKGLYWPFIKWELIFLACHSLFVYGHFYETDYSWQKYAEQTIRILTLGGGEQLLGGYWYLIQALYSSLIALLVIYGLSKLSSRLTTQRIVLLNKLTIGGGKFLLLLSIIVLLVAAYIYSLTRWDIPKLETKTFLATAFFLSGYLYSKEKHLFSYGKGILCLLPLLGCALIIDRTWSIDIQGGWIFPYYLLAMIGIIGTFHIAFAMRGQLANILDFIGQHTLQILTFHFLAFKLVSIFKIYVYGYNWDMLFRFPVIAEKNDFFWWVYVLAGVGLPLMGVRWGKKKL